MTNSVKWEITSKCNLRCKHCFLGNIELNDISIIQAKAIVDRLKRFKVEQILFTSKEPFAYANFLELLEYCTIQNIKVAIITNATLLTEKIIDKLYQLKIKTIMISLDGWDKKSNDAIRGGGVFEKVISALEIFKIKNEIYNTYIEITILTLITSINLTNIDEMSNFYNKYPNFNVSLDIIDLQRNAKKNEKLRVRWANDDDYSKKMYNQINQINQINSQVFLRDKSYYESVYINFIKGFNLLNIPPYCSIDNTTFSILSDGTLCKCMPLLDSECKVGFKLKYNNLKAENDFGIPSKDNYFENEEMKYKDNTVCKNCFIKENCRLCYITTSSKEKTNEQISICKLFKDKIEEEIKNYLKNRFKIKLSKHMILSLNDDKVFIAKEGVHMNEFSVDKNEINMILQLIDNNELSYNEIDEPYNCNTEVVLMNLIYKSIIIKEKNERI